MKRREGERERETYNKRERTPARLPTFSHTIPHTISLPPPRRSEHERVAANLAGQSRRRPSRSEHGRTVVRIATPASVLKPRPRSTVHDFRAPPLLFLFLSRQRRSAHSEEKKNRRSCRQHRAAPVYRRWWPWYEHRGGWPGTPWS